jgi:WD40 repeat protein
LNLRTNEVSFPFGLDDIENVVWKEDGRYVAYSAPNTIDVWDKTGRYIMEKKRKDDRYLSILMIKNISTDKMLLKKDIPRDVDDITWSPDFSAVALLTYTDKISKSWGDLIPAFVGHPYFIKTFYLEVYMISPVISSIIEK